MSNITWKESFSIGIRVIDDQHRRLIEIINDLYDAQRIGTSQFIMNGVINRLEEYTIYHFKLEEEMQSLNLYPDFNKHIEEHQEFIGKLSEFKQDSIRNNLLLSIKTIDYLKDWTINHILGSDRDFGEYLRKLEAA
ncbi:MAG TPA: bacteriohemerythrin [Melioribacteraceae bacterium]|nr:bacteriohemerythrin [Melioribacteraceae bacterium]